MTVDRLESSEDFEFGTEDRVLVRVRENGSSGNIEAKFEADVRGFRKGILGGMDEVELDPPWDSTHGVTLSPYDAEWEVLGGEDGDE
ncbi:hypothetical protein [Halobacterium hubeiense]|uniref:hypothetical protein n=1 Tax=Halobacterium hubeiense TaxID=1407499 RepID=UPI000B7F7E7B|nr:hypothetical protein [Halobacterium hubeiense]